MKKYRFLEHTADIKIEAWGETLEEAFSNAGIAFYDVVLDVTKVDKKIVREVYAKGFDLESLLFSWISELILVFELESLVFSDFKLVISQKKDKNILSGVGYGEVYDKKKHGYRVHVKAMTYHEMEIKKEGGRYIVDYIVDI